MPFPLAHPIAVLPLRRWVPRYFSLVGLVVGSVTPDAGYALRHLDFNRFTHSIAGSVLFCLPVGLIAAALVLAVRRPVASTFPTPHRQAVLPLCAGPAPAWWKLVLSVLVGAWTHLAFDALTHESALRAKHAETLQETVAAVEESGLKIYQVLWMIVSGGSMAFLGFLYLRHLKRATGVIRFFDPSDRKRVFLWAALLVMPYLLVVPYSYHVFEPGGFAVDKHALYGSLQPYLVLLTGVILALGFVIRSREPKGVAPPTPPAATTSSDTPAPPG